MKATGWDRQTIVDKIHQAVDTMGYVDEQRIRQWINVLRQIDPAEVFHGLYSVFTDESRERTKFLDQEYAGTLLLAVQPACPIEPRQAVLGVLRNYELSNEQLPQYFAAVFGRQPLIQILAKLCEQSLTEVERHSVKTFLFWLRMADEQSH